MATEPGQSALSRTQLRPTLWRAAVAFAVGAVVTVLGLLPSTPRLVVRSAEAHLVLETVVTAAAALAALLSYGRYRRGTAWRDLLLVHALVLLSVAALVHIALAELLDGPVGERAAAWAALLLRVGGAVALLGAALTAPGARRRTGRPVADVGVVVAVVAVVAGLAVLVSGRLPDVLRVSPALESSGGPALTAPLAALVAQVVTLGCFAGAGAVFARRAARAGDPMLAWFAAAAVLGAWARLSYLVYPSLYSDWFYAGDLLRLGCYLLLVVGAVVEIRTYWRVSTGIAVEAERRRLARDLHDGVVQELGWIRTQAARGADHDGIVGAADRALFEARRAIAALVSPVDTPLAEQVAQAAREAGDAVGVRVRAHVDADVDDERDEETAVRREALVRIVREAVLNAGRYSGATEPVVVRLAPGRLTVTDRGCGFDPDRHNGTGFGLVAMADRAEAAGATLTVRSTRGSGTTVEVSW
jgi:signal transduction histidine kinase